MAKKLTAGVLQGSKFTENMKVEWNGEEYSIEIKALDNKEATQVEELTQEGVSVKGKPGINGKMERQMDFDTKKNLRGRNQSDIKAVALGTTDESLTEKVIEQEFPPKLVKEIGKRVKQISGIGNQDETDAFSEGKDTPRDGNGEQ